MKCFINDLIMYAARPYKWWNACLNIKRDPKPMFNDRTAKQHGEDENVTETN